MLPVVKACAPHLLFVERESKRFDQVQRRAGGKTGPPGVAGVPVDLGMHEDHVNA